MPIGLSACLLWKNVYSILYPFFNWAVYFFRCWVVWVRCIFWILTFYQIHTLKMSALIQQVAFPSIDRFLFCVKAFRFGVVPFVLFLFFFSLAWGDRSKKILLRQMLKHILPMLSSSFVVSGLTVKSLIHFWSYFCMWCEKIVQTDSITHSSTVFLTPVIKEAVFSHCIFLLLCCRLIDHISIGLFWGSLFCSIDLCVCFHAST